MYVCCVLICCIGCKWQGFGSGIVQQCLLWEEIRGCPVPDMSGSSQLHNGPTGGQSWAQQPSVWCLWKHLGKVRTVGGMEEGNGGTLKSCVWDAPWSTRYTPKRDCSPRMSPCWGRYTPQDTAACEGHTLEHKKQARRKERKRGSAPSWPWPPAPAVVSLKGLNATESVIGVMLGPRSRQEKWLALSVQMFVSFLYQYLNR